MTDDKRRDGRSDTQAGTVEEIEQLAFETGITGEQAQQLFDRLGHDRVALEQAARNLRGRDG